MCHHDVWDYLHDTMLRLSCASKDRYIFESEDHTEQVPPFACSTSKAANGCHLLAVVDEDGFVTLLNTRHSAEVVKGLSGLFLSQMGSYMAEKPILRPHCESRRPMGEMISPKEAKNVFSLK